MRSPWFWLTLIGLVLVFWWMRPQPESTPSTVPIEPPTSPKPAPTRRPPARTTEKPRPQPAIAPPLVKALPPPTQSRGSNYAQQGLVHFKIEEGLAIAFGDIILGKLVDDENVQQGFVKPPPPQPWKAVEIAYAIAPELDRPERVEQAIDYFRRFTPVNFVPFQGQRDAIVFEPGEAHCVSYVGRIGGHQPIRLSNTCTWLDVVHEMMHALGFVHEQSRTDRDQFVMINWDNIEDEFKDQFAMVPEPMMSVQKGTPFDLQSVMIYPSDAFARDHSQPTMRSLGEAPIAPSQTGLSPHDIEKLNRLYGNKD